MSDKLPLAPEGGGLHCPGMRVVIHELSNGSRVVGLQVQTLHGMLDFPMTAEDAKTISRGLHDAWATMAQGTAEQMNGALKGNLWSP